MSVENTEMSTIYAAKRALRKTMQRRLREIPPDSIQQQSEAVRSRLSSNSLLQTWKAVCCYLSMEHGELDTTGIMQDLLESGRTVYVPVIPPSTSTTGKTAAHAEPSPEQDMRFLRLNSVADYRACLQRKDRWGIPSAGLRTLDTDEVRQDALEQSAPALDAILVPSYAFDRNHNRLGHGKGYYDRYIRRYRAHAEKAGRRPPQLIALSLREQLLQDPEAVPVTGDDELMDVVVTPDEWLVRDPHAPS